MSQRLDKVLLDQGLVDSRTQAQKLVLGGCVEILSHGQWLLLHKPSVKVSPDAQLKIALSSEQRYVSRAGLKLEAALKQANLDLTSKVALDIGQSTGGFTDCLLQQGASRVVGIDVGHDQLSPKIRKDGRVTCLEGINARNLPVSDLLAYQPQGYDVVVMDVSFISQTLILPHIPAVLASKAYLISLVKPQFELQPEDIGKGGIVKDEQSYGRVEQKISSLLSTLPFSLLHYLPSPITGGDGNKEFIFIAKHQQ